MGPNEKGFKRVEQENTHAGSLAVHGIASSFPSPMALVEVNAAVTVPEGGW